MIKPITFDRAFTLYSAKFARMIAGTFNDFKSANGYYAGFKDELEATFAGSVITIQGGLLLCQGRLIEFEGDTTVNVAGTGKGVVVARLRPYASNVDVKCGLAYHTGDYTLRQDDIYNVADDTISDATVYELPLYSFNIAGGSVSSIAKLISAISGATSVNDTIEIDRVYLEGDVMEITSKHISKKVVDLIKSDAEKVKILTYYIPHSTRKHCRHRFAFIHNFDQRSNNDEGALSDLAKRNYMRCPISIDEVDIKTDAQGNQYIRKSLNMVDFFQARYFYADDSGNFSSPAYAKWSSDELIAFARNNGLTASALRGYENNAPMPDLLNIAWTPYKTDYRIPRHRLVGTYGGALITYILDDGYSLPLGSPLFYTKRNLNSAGGTDFRLDNSTFWEYPTHVDIVPLHFHGTSHRHALRNNFKALTFKLGFAIMNDNYMEDARQSITLHRFKLFKKIVTIRPSFWRDNRRDDRIMVILKSNLID